MLYTYCHHENANFTSTSSNCDMLGATKKNSLPCLWQSSPSHLPIRENSTYVNMSIVTIVHRKINIYFIKANSDVSMERRKKS